MTGTHDFMSDDRVTALERVAQRLLDSTVVEPGTQVTYVEWFTNPPASRPDGQRVGYVMSVDDRCQDLTWRCQFGSQANAARW